MRSLREAFAAARRVAVHGTHKALGPSLAGYTAYRACSGVARGDDDGYQNSFARVNELDAEDRAATQHWRDDFVHDDEAAALHAIFADAPLASLAAKTLGDGPWAAILAQYEALRHDAAVGTSIFTVCDTLDAPHLRPSGIRERLHNGVGPAAFGLRTLVGHLTAARAKAADA